MSHLDSRLMLCAKFVRKGSRLADIGTDHAYLPVWLCQNSICDYAIAADINPEPLKRGSQTVASAGLEDRIETRLSDGLKEIDESEADDVVIAGMGGELIAKILSECSFARDGNKHFILQPMTRSEVLIDWLCENYFEIIEQDCCVASGKCYTVLLVNYTGKNIPRNELYRYVGELKPGENETHRRFIHSHINRLMKQAKGDSRCAQIADALSKIG